MLFAPKIPVADTAPFVADAQFPTLQPLLGVRAILFDGFGTLVNVARKRKVYESLFAASENPAQARTRALTLPLEFWDFVRPFAQGTAVASLREALDDELDSIEVFPGVVDLLAQLRRLGVKVGVGSNLAWPYVAPLKRLLGQHVDSWTLSCIEGVEKPSAAFYARAAERLWVQPSEMLRVGNCFGPAVPAVRSLHLVRSASQFPAAALPSGFITDLGQLIPAIGPEW